MKLYVMRHGPAEDRAASGRDADRRLTVSGRELVERAGRKLRDVRGRPVPRIVSSPLVRADETALIIWRLAGDPERPVEHHEDLSSDSDTPIDLVRAIAAIDVDTLVVGHNPNVEALVREIASPSHPFAGFRTATIAEVELADAAGIGSWPLATLFDPHRS